MSADLLFEIGCEEIPAKMLARQLEDLHALVGERFAVARITHGKIRVLGTPRRIAVSVADVADRQPDLDEEIVGPPIGAAFAPDGTLSKAGQGWATKIGVGAEQIEKKEVAGKKGQYAVAKKHVAGGETRALLPAILGALVPALPWPKSQRWGWGEERFVRPVQWLVALYGGEVVPFVFGELTSGRRTRGHRFLSSGWIDLADAAVEGYIDVLRTAKVLVDPAARTARVEAELARVERETGLRVRPDAGLVAEVANLGEWPTGVVGTFDPAFLEIPAEIIVTAMRNHQRYFAVEQQDGALANRFVTMMATEVEDTALVEKGNQYVIASRLADARFFVATDRAKGSFAPWNDKLDAVTFQAKLPPTARMTGHKVRRIADIVAGFKVASLEPGSSSNTVIALEPGSSSNTVIALEPGSSSNTVIRHAVDAARVCKADLASEAVGEFPELQGVMGRHYAHDFGLAPEIGAAIDEHWWPKGQGGALPASEAGAIVGLADKMDSVIGAFAVDLVPSGSADPLGLRRAAIGIWQILMARGWSFEQLFEATATALAAQGVTLKDRAKLDEFFKTRLRGILVESGLPTADVDAALAQGWKDPIDARARAQACAKISKEAREVFKRVANILDDARAKKIEIAGACDPRLFVATPPGAASAPAAPGNVEQRLYDAVFAAQERERAARAARDYGSVFESLEQLRPTVAAFFDKGGVMVMDPDPKLRDNRLALLQWFVAPYLAIADFRLLAGAVQ